MNICTRHPPADVTVGPTTHSTTKSNPPPTTTATSPSTLPSSSPASTDPTTGLTTTTNNTIPIGEALSTSEPAPDMIWWWAILITLLVGLIAGFVVGIFVSLFYQVQRARKMAEKTTPMRGMVSEGGSVFVPPPIVATNDKRRGSRRGSSGSVGMKPNNAVDPVVEPKGQGHSKGLSPEQCERSVTSADITEMHCSQSENSLFLGNKRNAPPTASEGTVRAQPSNSNLVDSSSECPQTPVTNYARDHFKGNIDSEYSKPRLTSTSSACAGPGENHRFSLVSQGSYAAAYNGAVGNTNTLPRSQAGYSRPTPMDLVLPQLLPSHGDVDGYAQVGSPMSASGRMMSLEQRRSLLLSTPDRYANGHVTIPYSNCSDC